MLVARRSPDIPWTLGQFRRAENDESNHVGHGHESYKLSHPSSSLRKCK